MQVGRSVGSFDVLAKVGEGGMGEVYRARDSRLNRDVAIKTLLPAVASDRERLARFSREAQVLASLNHPNIAHIHGLEDGDSGPFLVMEFVEGPTLAERIQRGRLPIDEAIAIARQVAEALEAAHERGVIHRDLKPANIKVTDDGTVKILDFGLAKAIDPGAAAGEAGSAANSPTITTPAMTQAGLILGTAAYMSPEQAKGRPVDKRSDVWAFGCVLYEMLTARRAFDGEDATDTIALVVRGEPEWTALPADTPPQIRLLLKRCLEKDRRSRISDIGVARFLMNETIGAAPALGAAAPPAANSRGRVVTAAGIGLITGVALIAGAWAWSSRRPSERVTPIRFVLTPPADIPLVTQGNDHDVAIAPDASFIVYRSRDADKAQPFLAIRRFDELEPRVLAGTANARYPFISPDGQWIGFQTGNELRKVSISGGSPITICRVQGSPRGASWGDDDHIVFGSAINAGIMRVPSTGGEPAPLTSPSDAGEIHFSPHVLPGSKAVLFTAMAANDAYSLRLEAIEVATGRQHTVLRGAHDAAYFADGFLLYGVRDSSLAAETRFQGSLLAAEFDVNRLEVRGEPVRIIETLAMSNAGAANYAASRNGALVYVAGSGGAAGSAVSKRTLTWVDRQGRETPLEADPRSYALARISPDGTRIALDVRDQSNDIWVWDIARKTMLSLNRDPAQDMSPVWTPDGTRIVWTSTRAGGNPNLYWQAADGAGAPERLTTHQSNQFPTAVTPDGATVVLFGNSGNAANTIDLFTASVTEPGKTEPLVAAAGFDFGGEISPDGRWIAYHSNESGEFQVYVRPFPNVQAGRMQMSSNGGSRAAWRRDGRELFYLDKDGFLTSVTIQPSPTGIVAGTPTRILKEKYHAGSTILGLDLRAYDVSADGRRFLMVKDSSEPRAAGVSSMIVMLNSNQALKARR